MALRDSDEFKTVHQNKVVIDPDSDEAVQSYPDNPRVSGKYPDAEPQDPFAKPAKSESKKKS